MDSVLVAARQAFADLHDRDKVRVRRALKYVLPGFLDHVYVDAAEIEDELKAALTPHAFDPTQIMAMIAAIMAMVAQFKPPVPPTP